MKNRIAKFLCNHTDKDGKSELEFLANHYIFANVGMDKSIWSTWECSHCGAIVSKDERYEKTESSGDDCYFDRNQAALLAAKLAHGLGMPVGVKPDPEWPILFIELPSGQVSWHIPAAELAGEWDEHTAEWDGHTLAQKRERIADLITR